jgi:probable rRNA maturation factor
MMAGGWAKFYGKHVPFRSVLHEGGVTRRQVKEQPRKQISSNFHNQDAVHLSVHHGPYRGIGRQGVKRAVHAMLGAVERPTGASFEVSVLLTSDEEIHELNKTYRRKDRPTDVLAFAMREGKLGELSGGMVGDIVVSIPTAMRQAAERNISLRDETWLLLAHGLLHLLGWDHRTDAEDRRMRAETERLLAAARPARAGLAPPAPVAKKTRKTRNMQ